MLALPGALRAKRTSKEPQPGMTSCLIRRMADMPHDSADRAGREGARDSGGVGPQEAQPPAAGNARQEAEAKLK